MPVAANVPVEFIVMVPGVPVAPILSVEPFDIESPPLRVSVLLTTSVFDAMRVVVELLLMVRLRKLLLAPFVVIDCVVPSKVNVPCAGVKVPPESFQLPETVWDWFPVVTVPAWIVKFPLKSITMPVYRSMVFPEPLSIKSPLKTHGCLKVALVVKVTDAPNVIYPKL